MNVARATEAVHPAAGWWSRAPNRRFVLIAAALSVAAFDVSWVLLGWLLDNGFYGYLVISDVGLYQRVGDAVLGGQLPYRDFPLAYPPAALPAFVLPSLLGPAGDRAAYDASFEALMLLCGALATVLVLVATWQAGWPRSRIALAAAFVAVSPLLIGPVILSRFDLWPAALTAAALAAAAAGRLRLGSVLLAVAVMAKVYPWVVVPLLLAYAWRRSGPREAAACAVVGLATGLLILAPFLVDAPQGVVQALLDAASRPLQVESLGASLIFVLYWIAGTPVEVVTNFGSQNLVGALPDALLVVQSLVLVAVLVAVWVWFARGAAGPGRFLWAAAAALCAYVALGKVLSPQYMIWLIPVVPLVGGRRGLVAAGALALALLLTVDYFPRHYFEFVRLEDAGAALVVFMRDVVLVALVAVLVLPWEWLAMRARAAYRAFDRRVPVASLVPDAAATLVLVVVASFLLRALWLNLPAGSLIFDEAYYVNAARVMLGIHPPPGAHYADAPLFLDPNNEHPPLGKALIAISMFLFGDSGLGWRIPSLVAGMVSLLALYGIVRAAGGRPWLGVLTVILYSLDILSFIHGRIGTLDMMSLAFLLVGAWLWLRQRWLLAGAALALGTLVKVPGVYGLLAALAWQGLAMWTAYRRGTLGWRDVRPAVLLVGSYVVVVLAGLWVLDQRFTTYATPFEHIGRMIGYGFALQPTFNPSGITSAPWQWLVNAGQFDYFKTAVNTLVDGQVTGSRTTIEFRALLNPVLIGTASLAVLYGAWLAWKRREALATWGLVWVAANYLPFWILAIFANRITYFYYILPSIPGLAVLTAVLLVHGRLPRLVVWAYLAASVVAFVAYFPFRQVP